jgi:hypothetical protein
MIPYADTSVCTASVRWHYVAEVEEVIWLLETGCEEDGGEIPNITSAYYCQMKHHTMFSHI